MDLNLGDLRGLLFGGLLDIGALLEPPKLEGHFIIGFDDLLFGEVVVVVRNGPDVRVGHQVINTKISQGPDMAWREVSNGTKGIYLGECRWLGWSLNHIQIKKVRMRVQNIIVLLGVAALACAKLEVINFAQINSEHFDAELTDIPYSIANFGFSPFGKTMIANLRESPGLSKECFGNESEAYPKDYQNSFLLIPRGDCPFVTKALHAQEMGAAMAIIMDDEEHERGVIMKDNGYGYKVKIPTIFINHKMGVKLLGLVNRTDNKVVLKIAFENTKTDRVQVNLYLQAGNALAYRFVEEFEPFYKKIENYVVLNVVYDFISCKACNSNDCYYNGAYCSVNYEHEKSATGQDVMNQQLRESVMFAHYFKKWWAYMKCIKNECIYVSELEECSNTCVKKKLKMNLEEFTLKVKDTFSYDGDNPIMKSQSAILSNSGVELFPAVTINSIRLKGSLQAEFVFDDICNSLISPPSVCSEYVKVDQRYSTRTKMYWFTVFCVIVLGAGLFAGLFVVFRRKMRRRMTTEMQGRVDDMVSKYIEFYSERNNR